MATMVWPGSLIFHAISFQGFGSCLAHYTAWAAGLAGAERAAARHPWCQSL